MLYLLLIFVLISADQIVKVLISSRMVEGESIAVLFDFFHITYVKNRGVAFGMLQGKVSIISVVTIAAIVGLTWYLIKNRNKDNVIEKLAYTFILSGAVGNMIDRVTRGFVVDMMDFRGIWRFVFNLADVWINIGVALILLDYILESKKKTENSVEGESK